LDNARKIALSDERIILIEEIERRGKADAINKILSLSKGEFVVFVNSDALPDQNSINKLLTILSNDCQAGVVSARAYFVEEAGSGFVSDIEHLMWTAHNECSLLLNHMGLSNHSCDELMVVRRDILDYLSAGLVNDGSYIASRLRRKGYSVKFCNEASVKIDVPRKITGQIAQRRRIIFGHLQVKKLTGRMPKTTESMLLMSPRLGFMIPIKIMGKNPRLVWILPIAILGETISTLLALSDFVRSTTTHSV
jgi:cellulose synthase/poly-beta-1,6-N-acetylglucosamine synthase-like glycosyltransferase